MKSAAESKVGAAARSAWIDVSVPLRSGMVHWPGDPEVAIDRVLSLGAGDGANVTHVRCSAHVGTHVDAPLHFIDGAAAVDTIPLDVCIGPARVLHIEAVGAIEIADLAPHAVESGERIILRTRNSTQGWRSETFYEDFVALSAAAARWLAEKRLRLLGIDYLSVSRFRDEAAAVHVPLLSAGVWIIEGLDLSAAPVGPVDLICLPLRLFGADGAPARVVLRRRDG